MWNLINAPETEIFGIAIALMVLLGVLEVTSMLAGGISDWLDNLLPDSLTETAHAEVGLDAADAGVFVRFLSWLYVGRVPVLMLMVVFLAVYGLTGYLFQTTFAAVFGSYLNGWLAAVAVWFISLPLVRLTAGGLYKIMPKDETTAVSQESLIGRIGTVVLGEARAGSATFELDEANRTVALDVYPVLISLSIGMILTLQIVDKRRNTSLREWGRSLGGSE